MQHRAIVSKLLIIFCALFLQVYPMKIQFHPIKIQERIPTVLHKLVGECEQGEIGKAVN